MTEKEKLQKQKHDSYIRNIDKYTKYYTEYRKKNKSMINKKAKEYSNKPERKEHVKKLYMSPKNIAYRRNFWLKKRYGITQEDYLKLLKSQNNVCAICKGKNLFPKQLAVDHCHITSKVRGILCGKCNRALGGFNDDLFLLKNAIDYLKKYDRR